MCAVVFYGLSLCVLVSVVVCSWSLVSRACLSTSQRWSVGCPLPDLPLVPSSFVPLPLPPLNWHGVAVHVVCCLLYGAVHVAWCTMLCCCGVARCTMLSPLWHCCGVAWWHCCACCLVYYAVLLWCCPVYYAVSSMGLLWCCLVYYAVSSMALLWCCLVALLCMLPGVLCCLLYGVAVVLPGVLCCLLHDAAVHVAWCTMLSLWRCTKHHRDSIA